MKDAVGTHLVDDLNRDYKKVDVGATLSQLKPVIMIQVLGTLCLRSSQLFALERVQLSTACRHIFYFQFRNRYVIFGRDI